MSALQEFRLNESVDEFLFVQFKESGGAIAELRCGRKDVNFYSSGTNLYIPNSAITAVGTGVIRASRGLFIAALLFGLFGVGVLIKWLSNTEDISWAGLGFVAFAVAAVFVFLYINGRMLRIGIYTGGNSPIVKINAKGVKVDFEKIRRAAILLEKTVLECRTAAINQQIGGPNAP